MNLTSLSIEKFLSVLKQSGLLEEAPLQDAWTKFQQPAESASSLTAESFATYLVEQELITSWHATKLLKGKHKGYFLGKYKLLGLLGKGGMSSVYLAEHLAMKRRCAVKVLPHKLVTDSSYLSRFYREAQVVAALDHPNIVRAYDVDHQTDGNMEIHFLVMEYVSGFNFYELVKRQGPLPPRQAAEFIRQGALGLEHAHGAGMVHRDVKPGNFIIDDNGTVKVMDLGLAMVREEKGADSVTLANEEKVLGTADYLAPEQAIDSHLVDSRADLYALGCTFFFLLTGRPPFNEGTLTQRLLAHQTKAPPAIQEFRDDVPAELIEILARMMMKDPSERFQTAGEVARELADWLAKSPHQDRSQNVTFPFLPPNVAAVEQDHHNGAISDFLAYLQDAPEGKSGASTNPGANSNTEISRKTSDHRSDSRLHESSDSGASVFSSGPSSIVSHAASHQLSRKQLRKRLGLKLANVLLIAAAVISGSVVLYILNSPRKAVVQGVPPQATQELGTPRFPTISGPVIRIGPQGDFTRLGDAIQYLLETAHTQATRNVNEIRIAAGQTLDETIRIENSVFASLPPRLRIVGEGPQWPILRSTQGPVFILDSIEELSISDLQIDCADQPVGVELTGYLTGTSFNNVTFQNLSDVGVLARGVSGLTEHRFRLNSCRFVAQSPTATAVRFVGSELFNTRQVSIEKSQFIGPMATAILLSSPHGSTWDVNITQCLFYETQSAITFAGEDHDVSRVNISNNTFYRFTHGIHFESGPVPASSGVTFLQNLFVSSDGIEVATEVAEVSLETLSRGEQFPQSNWTTGRVKEASSWLNIFEKNGKTSATGIEFVSTDPNSPQFLKPIGPTLSDAVQEPIAGRKFIGAVPP